MTRSGLRSSKRLNILTVNESDENVEIAFSDTSTGFVSGYEHTSSEIRAFNRINDTMPNTLAKRVRMVEKVVEKSTLEYEEHLRIVRFYESHSVRD